MTRRNVCVVTGSRAEYGLFYPILNKIQSSRELNLQLVVTSTHLSSDFGSTFKQIENDGFTIDGKIDNLFKSDSAVSIAKSAGSAIILLSDCLDKLKPDVVLLLGDRFETHAAATTALLLNIPIAHIHGGEITEGAVDEQIRHSITKMSFLHFCSTDVYRNRVIQMGEDPLRVFNNGAPGIDNIVNYNLLSKASLEKELKWKFHDKTALFTYHPVTLSNFDHEIELSLILQVIEASTLGVLFTYANADRGGRAINQMIELFCKKNPIRFKVVKSLGQLKYLSSISHASLLIGNSSSGIIEAASFYKPVINIGDRQLGRLKGLNVIDTGTSIKDLADSINLATSSNFVKQCQEVTNIYGEGNSAKKIVNHLINNNLSVRKSFIDIK